MGTAEVSPCLSQSAWPGTTVSWFDDTLCFWLLLKTLWDRRAGVVWMHIFHLTLFTQPNSCQHVASGAIAVAITALWHEGRSFFFFLDLLRPVCKFSSKPFCTLTFSGWVFSLNLFLGNPSRYSDQMHTITQTHPCKCCALSL